MASKTISVSCECAPNIALVKYWGKANEELIIPLNSSISITLDRNVLCSRTNLTLTPNNLKKISVNLNGAVQEFERVSSGEPVVSLDTDLLSRKRLFKMLHKVYQNSRLAEPESYSIEISSVNNFPTACGLASSASGFACLAHCLALAFEYEGDTSELARLGSGSACRSCHGGFVKWLSGTESAESVAREIVPHTHWPELNILSLILEDQRKNVSSTNGMRDSVLTSEFLKARVELVERTRLSEMEEAIQARSFTKLAELTMKDSNSFHSVCMDTYPPLFYLNDKSKEIIQLVNQFNSVEKDSDELKVAYSFDAGPNAFLFVLDEHLNELLFLVYTLYFCITTVSEEEWLTKYLVASKSIGSTSVYFNSISSERKSILREFCEEFKRRNRIQASSSVGLIKYVLHSKVGQEPLFLKNQVD
jgi:diphosphomevalonate decarboxylase